MGRPTWQHAAIVSAITVICLIGGCASECPNAPVSKLQKTKPPLNVILITISSLRADHVGSLGYARDTTPSFDAFGRENVLFRNAFAASGWMMPAHGSIFTSLYPNVHGGTHINNKLGLEHDTLAEILKAYGYYCIGFCCSPRLDREHGFAQGFDIYDDYSVPLLLQSMTFENEESLDINKQITNELINDAAIRWLRNNTHKPFFMFLHYYDNHWDYLPPPPYDQLFDPNYQGPIDGTKIAREPLYSNPPGDRDIQHIIALYDGEVRKTDNDLGEMLRFLKDKGLCSNSIVIVLADHGEQFYEHGRTSHQGLFEELIHIPLAVSIPAAQAERKTIDCLVSQMDILPTILDYLAIPIPEKCRGKSLKPIIEGEVGTVNEFVFAEYTGGAIPDSYVVRSARYKYYEQAGEAFAFDLLADPTEQRKVFPDGFPELLQPLREKLKRLRPEP